MHLIQKVQTNNKWIRRGIRIYNLSVILLNDFSRAFSWHIGGGKRFYTRHFREIANSHKWCFIVACNNSGTSLLQNILEKSDTVSTLPYEGQIYTRVLARARRKGFERVWSEYSEKLTVNIGHSLRDGPRLLHDWTKDLKTPLHELIVEKTPANILRMTWLQRIFHKSYFVGLIRNGYAVAEGIKRKGNKDISRAARHWNIVNKKMLDESKRVRRFLLLNYEQLSEHPEKTMKQLANFLELDPQPLEQAVCKTFDFTTVAGSGPSPIQNLNDESIARLSSDDITKIRTNADEMLEYFGYKIDKG